MPDDAQWPRIKALVADALECDGEARARVLAALDGEPSAVADRVRALVAAAESGVEALPEPRAAWMATGHAPRDWSGETIGGYRVLRFLARGGMGEVYEAEQLGTGRRAALKLLTRGGSRDRSRFQLEGRLLGRLQHPSIAQVLDADVHRAPDGTRWPYLALELVDGLPLTAAVQRAELDRTARLRLFVDLCRGVEHAHRMGVVHRDLKPDNILVAPPPAGESGPGRVKILDFGVAALTDEPDAQTTTRLTQVGDLIGTLAYMAPEQVDPGSVAVDARTDVHALGVILYELLIDRLPFELTGRSLTESLSVLREGIAPLPSRFDRSLRGDLDTIATTALAKVPARRYQSAAALAADVERYLNHVPIEARPATGLYRAVKFAQRHRRLVAATGFAVAALALGLVGTSIGLLRARAEVRHTNEVNDFLAEVLGTPSPDVMGRDVRFREVLDAHAPEIDTRFAHRPLSAAKLHASVGWAYFDLGEKLPALFHLDRARNLFEQSLGSLDPRTLRARRQHLTARVALEEPWPDAVAEADQLVADMREALGPEHPETLLAELDLASALEADWDLQAAVDLQRDLLQRIDRLPGVLKPAEVDTVLSGLATTLNLLGEQSEALALFDRIARRLTERHGPTHPATLHNDANRAVTLSEMALYDEALALCEAIDEPLRATFGPEHPTVLSLRSTWGSSLVGFGRFDEAASMFEEVVAIRERVLGRLHLDTLVALNNLVVVYSYQERWSKSEPLLTDLIERTSGLEDDGGIHLSARGLLANALAATDRLEEARAMTEENIAGFAAVFGAEHPNTLVQRNNLARLLHTKLGRPAEAAAILSEVLEAWQTSLPEDHGMHRRLLWNLGRAQAAAGQLDAAERSLLAVGELAALDPGASVDADAWRSELDTLLARREESNLDRGSD